MTETVVGRGAFGTVVHCCNGNDVYAKKYVSKYWQYVHEVNMMHTVQGIPGVMPLLGVDVQEHAIRMPYFRLNLHNYATTTLSWTHPKNRIKIVRRIIIRLMRIVADLHDFGIAHLDIKPENVMLEEDPSTSVFRPILTDFGVAMKIGADLGTKKGVGTPGFIAPEVFEKGYTVRPSADVYSLGKTLEDIVGAAGLRDKPLADIVGKMCQTSPDKRITMQAAMRHTFFRGSSLGQCFKPVI